MRIARTISLRTLYFNNVAAGLKMVEGRVRKPDFLQLRVNDIIRFKEQPAAPKTAFRPRHIDVKVTFLRPYPTFREMLEKEGLVKCLPGILTLEEGIAVYHSFPRYRDLESKLGVLAIGIKTLRSYDESSA